MDERTCITVEIDTFLWVEEHVLTGIHLQDEVFQGTHTNDAGNLTSLFLSHIVEFAQFHRGLIGIFHHQSHQVVGINHRPFTTLHLTVRQLHHTIGEVGEFLAPLESQTIEQDREHLEVIVLLVAHHIDHLIDGEILETHLSRSDVLSHINASSIATKQEFLVQTLVGEVGPYGVVLMALEETFGESFLYLGLTFQIGLALIVDLIERYTHLLIGLVKTCIYPVVHLLPKGAHFRVVLLPFHQHLVGFLDEWSLLFGLLLIHALGHQFLDFIAIMLVEGHVIVANQVITLLARALRRLAIAPLQPGQHRLADVDTTIVHDIGLHHLVAISLHNLSQ